MPSVFSAMLADLASWFHSRHHIQLEILTLRHQIAVYQHRIKAAAPALRSMLVGRPLAALLRLASGPRIDSASHRHHLAEQTIRDYWRRLRQSGKIVRLAITKDVRNLIQDMWRANPTWGSPRIVGEPNLVSPWPNQQSRSTGQASISRHHRRGKRF